MGKVLVSGGTGFVAKSLIEYLRANDYDVWFLSRSKSKDPKSFQVDFTNPSDLNKVLSNHFFDTIIHAAAQIPEPENKKDLELCQKVNFNGTSNLLQFAVVNNIRRFVYLSSISVFNGCNEKTINEETTPFPNSDYAISKLSAEYLCRYYSSTYDIKTPILRIGTVYGAGMNQSRMINFFIEKCKNHETFEIYNANIKLHTVYIKDVVEVISMLMNVNEGIYHLVTDTKSKGDIVKSIKKLVKSNSKITYKNNDAVYPMSFSIAKLKNIIFNNKQGFHDFESGIKDFVKH